MYKYILAVAGLLLITSINLAQDKMCGVAAAPAKFASLGSDKDFRNAHANPLPFKLEKPQGKMISFPTDDGTDAKAYFLKAKKKTDKYLLVFQEWYGLNDYVKKESDELYNALDVNVLALDLYDGKVADDREQAAKYVQAVDNNRVFNIIKGAFKYAGAGAEFATLGWCFGGSWSLQAAIEAGDDLEACVMFYGMPEDDPERLKMIDGPVLAIFANKDQHITPEIADKFESDMKKLNKEIWVERYDADHAFANPSNPVYDSKAAKDAKAKALAFLKKHLD
jgi:carboxymethylenebutenolidase